MHQHSDLRRQAAILGVALSALWMSAGDGLASQTANPDLRVVVFPEHYVVAGRRFDDVRALESAVLAMRPRAVGIDACGVGTERAQRAAAYHLRSLPLELRVLEPDAPGCRVASAPRAVQVGQSVGRRPLGIDDAAVDRWWHQLMP